MMFRKNVAYLIGIVALTGLSLYLTPVYLWPAIAVVSIAVASRRVLFALATGVIIAAIIISKGNFVAGLQLAVTRFWAEATAKDHVYIFGFLLNLGFLIELMTHAGAMRAYTRTIGEWLKTRRSVQTTSLLLSSLFFIDDYLSNLLVGNIMRPLVDIYGISRVKLAYLLNSMAASFCVLIPATSWVAMILVQLQISGITEHTDKNPLILADPYIAYLSFMPFLFYPALTVFGAWFVVQFGISWGLMERFERRAETHASNDDSGVEGSLLDFAVPLGTFIGAIIFGVGFTGGYYLLGGQYSFLEAVQKADIFAVLFYASLIAVAAALGWYSLRKNNMGKITGIAFLQAISVVKNSLLLLSLAWTLSSFFRFELQAGQQLAAYLQAVPFRELIPVLVFLLSAGISAITGTAWGTIGLLFPLVIPLVSSLNAPAIAVLTMPLLLPSLAAVISGSIAGGQISPIADSVCMSAMSAGAPLLDHVQTQQQYVIPVWIATIVAYFLVVFLPFGSLINVTISWILALCIVVSFHLLKNKAR